MSNTTLAEHRRDRDTQDREDHTCPSCGEVAWDTNRRRCGSCLLGHVHCVDCGAGQRPGDTCAECAS